MLLCAQRLQGERFHPRRHPPASISGARGGEGTGRDGGEEHEQMSPPQRKKSPVPVSEAEALPSQAWVGGQQAVKDE